MRSQACGNAQTMLNESVVRASVIRYLLANESQAPPIVTPDRNGPSGGIRFTTP